MTVQVHEAATVTVPTTMRAAAIDRYGGPEVLTIHVLPVPKLDAGEVLIAVHTAGVGGWDANIRAGWSPGGRLHFPLVLGTDGSGTVAAVGSHVRRFKRGDKVYAYSWNNPKGGFYAEYVTVPSEKPEPKKRRGIKTIPYDASAGKREFEHLGRAVEAANLKVPIAGEYALDDAANAHERLAAGHVLGKIVLRVR